jgi:hypothetical protein
VKYSNIYHIAPKRSGHAFVGNMIKSWCPNSNYHDLENMNPGGFAMSEPGVIVLQTRDLLNWYASYYQQIQQPNMVTVLKWFNITREYFEPDKLEGYDVVNVAYEDFFASRAYRQGICAQIEGEYNEEWLNKITKNGGGSSFTGLEKNGNAQELQVLDRYKQVDPNIYLTLFRRKENLLEFYKKYCGDHRKLQFLEECGLR